MSDYWRIFELPDLKTRFRPLVCPLGKNLICIYSGFGADDDGMLFNTDTKTVSENFKGQGLELYSYNSG